MIQELGIATLNLENGKRIACCPNSWPSCQGSTCSCCVEGRDGTAWASSAGSRSRTRSRPGAGTAVSRPTALSADKAHGTCEAIGEQDALTAEV